MRSLICNDSFQTCPRLSNSLSEGQVRVSSQEQGQNLKYYKFIVDAPLMLRSPPFLLNPSLIHRLAIAFLPHIHNVFNTDRHVHVVPAVGTLCQVEQTPCVWDMYPDFPRLQLSWCPLDSDCSRGL